MVYDDGEAFVQRVYRGSRRLPMRVRFSNGSNFAAVSFNARSMIDPTVRQAMRISLVTANLEVWVASQEICCSKILVRPAWWRVQGTAATVTPCSGQRTRGPGGQDEFHRSQIQGVPASGSVAAVVARAAPPADPAAVAGGFVGADRGQQDAGVLAEV